MIDSENRFVVMIHSDSFLATADLESPTTVVGANQGNHNARVNGKPVEGCGATGQGVAVFPTYLLAGCAEGCARFMIDSMRSGFALTRYDHSNHQIGKTQLFNDAGELLRESDPLPGTEPDEDADSESESTD